MKTHLTSIIAALALAAAAGTAVPVQAATGVGVSIGINQPGVYGRIDIGGQPQPELIYAQPVVVAPPRVAVQRRPIYLYVPPGQERDWRRYCGRYSACDQPVYFVRDEWVRDRYAREHPGWRDRRVERRPDFNRGPNRHDDRRDRDRRDERGDRDHRGDRRN